MSMSAQLHAKLERFLDAMLAPEYQEYVVLLNQALTAAPVASVLQNTLGGTPVFTRTSDGQYRCTLAGAFPPAKTVIFGMVGADALGAGGFTSFDAWADATGNFIDIYTAYSDVSGTPLALADNLLVNTAFVVRVYP